MKGHIIIGILKAMSPRKTVYLIDAPIYVFRAYFSLPASITDQQGKAANAIYGYTQFLCSLLREEKPVYIAAAFDESLTSSFRNEWYESYKANRELPPEELEDQFDACKRLTRALGVRTYTSARYEADDLIATIAAKAHDAGLNVTVVSRDKDLAQLIGSGDRLWDGADGPRMSARHILEKFGVKPRQIPDYLALVGDTIDNIPGVPGVGPKAATTLLQRFGTLEGIYKNLDKLPTLPLRGAQRLKRLLEDYWDQAFLSLKLAVLHTGSRIRCEPSRLEWAGPKPRSVSRLFQELGFGERLKTRCLDFQTH